MVNVKLLIIKLF